MQLRRENQAEIGDSTVEQSHAKKCELLQHVTKLFLQTLDRQRVSDTDVFDDVLNKVAFQVDDSARSALSEQLSILDRAPVKLIRRLASDVIQVAKPVLEFSPCLDEPFLANIVRTKSQDHIFAVAGRPLLTSVVTDEIVVHGEPFVLYRVGANTGASFSHQGLEALTSKAVDDSELGHALCTRQDVSEQLKDQISNGQVEIRPGEFFALEFDNLREECEAEEAESETIKGEQVLLSYAEEDVDDAILAYSADIKDTEETVANFAKMAGVTLPTARYLLLKGEIPALVIISKASRIKSETFEALLKFRIGAQNLNPSIAAPNVERYNNLGSRTAERLATILKTKLAKLLPT